MRLVCFILLFATLNSYNVAAQAGAQNTDSIYNLSFADLDLSVDAAHGAKISSLKLKGHEFLIPKEQGEAYMWGSTLWPAPQKQWGWPPLLILDNGTYETKVLNDTLIFESGIELNMQFIKKYWINKDDTTLCTSYELKNKGDKPLNNALWEVTRVPANGLVFWSTGKGQPWGKMNKLVENIDGYSWIDITKVGVGKQKLFADTKEGWFAFIDSEKRLFVRTFTNVDPVAFAEGEAEIEFYVDGDFMELENLSGFETIEPLGNLKYATKWYIRYLPKNINVEMGNSQIIDIVTKITSENN